MKYIVVSIPGAADYVTSELGEKTAFDLAKIPNLHYFAKNGKVGRAELLSKHHEPGADISFLATLGYDVDKVYTGQGPLEAANLELQLEENEVAFRMNFITESEGALADPTAGNISSKEAKALINYLNKKLASDFVRFFASSKYRHIAVIKDAHGFEALSAKTHSPESISGKVIEDYFPKGPGDELLKKLMFDARLLLQDHEINQVRVDLHENPANMIWLWGQGQRPKMEKFSDKYEVTGSVIADREYAQGVGRLAHLTVIELPPPSHEGEIDYQHIANLMQGALVEMDFVCLHLDGCDEASLRGDSKGKISTLEAIDFFIFSRIRKYIDANKDVRVLVTPGHPASWKERKYLPGAVPVVMAGKNVKADDIEQFSETTGEVSELSFKNGSEMMDLFFGKS